MSLQAWSTSNWYEVFWGEKLKKQNHEDLKSKVDNIIPMWSEGSMDCKD